MFPFNIKPSLLGKRRPVGSHEYIVALIKLLQIGPSEMDSLWNTFVFISLSSYISARDGITGRRPLSFPSKVSGWIVISISGASVFAVCVISVIPLY